MSVLAELEKRLAENEKRITRLIQHLEDHAELEESLESAVHGLEQANTRIKRLADSAQIANASLADVLDSFRDAVEILRQSDPAKAAKAIKQIEDRLSGIEDQVKQAIGEAANAVSSGQEKVGQQLKAETQAITDAIKQIEDKLSSMEARTKAAIDEATNAISRKQERAEQHLKAEAQAIRESAPTTVVYITLVVVLVLLGFEILRYLLAMLPE